jgi:glutamyl-tRNA reductase
MSLLLVGLSHQSAPVEVRERYAVAPARVRPLCEKLLQEPGCHEVALVSTCNRTELLVVTEQPTELAERVHAFFGHEIGDGSAEPAQLYELHEREAVEHLFRVACSLDSMVLGEVQITGQLKQAHREAVAAGSCGPLLNRLFERAFRTAKRVHSETGLGASPISVARVGVQLASAVFESFADKRVVLIGAGEMAESALHGLRDAGARELVVLNRTPETARALARRFSARAAPLDTLESELAGADVALSSVQVDRPLLGAADLVRVMAARPGRPLLLIDLGIPRNFHPDAGGVDDVYLYDLDALDEVAARGRARRREAVGPAQAIVRDESQRYLRWRAGLDAVPVMRELQGKITAMARRELELAGREFESDGAREALERAAHRIARKLLHTPLQVLRGEAEQGRGPYYAEAVREIFGLSEEDE